MKDPIIEFMSHQPASNLAAPYYPTVASEGYVWIGEIRTSLHVDQIAPALVRVQGEIKKAIKDSKNPFFSSTYADLSSVWDSCRDALQANRVAVIQSPISNVEGIGVQTMLLHESGQYLTGYFVLPLGETKEGKVTSQAGGSAVTYARRYALAAMVGICSESDDDGNEASSYGKTKVRKIKKTPSDVDVLSAEGVKKLRELIAEAGASEQTYLDQFELEDLEHATVGDARAIVPLLKARPPAASLEN